VVNNNNNNNNVSVSGGSKHSTVVDINKQHQQQQHPQQPQPPGEAENDVEKSIRARMQRRDAVLKCVNTNLDANLHLINFDRQFAFALTTLQFAL